MAFPTTITALFPALFGQGRTRPYISSAGNVYVVLKDPSNSDEISVQKATDPTSSFSEAASLGLANSGVLLGLGTHQDGDDIHIATQDDNDVLLYHVFSMSSDSFTTSNQAVTSAVGTKVDAEKAISIELKENGDQLLFYNGDEDNAMGAKARVDFAFKTSGSWTVDQAVDAGGKFNYLTGGVVRGASDLFHLVFHDVTGRDANHRSLTLPSTLSAVENCADGSTQTVDFGVINPVFYDDSGVERITVGWMRDDSKVTTAEIDDDGTPGAEEQASDDVDAALQFVVASTAVDEKRVWLLVAAAGEDLFTTSNNDSGGWDTDVEFLDAVNVTVLTTGIFQRGSDIVLAMVYDNGGTIQYNEKVLRPLSSPPPLPVPRFHFLRRVVPILLSIMKGGLPWGVSIVFPSLAP